MNQKISKISFSMILSIVLVTISVSAYSKDFYAGKTIKIVTNASAGGSTGISSQTFANFLPKHIPGAPKVIVQPMPGGAQLKGINFVMNAKADGLTIGWAAWGGATRVINPPKRQVAFDRFAIIGGMGVPPMVLARRDLSPDLKSAEDFAKLKKVTYGGFRSSSTYDMRARLSLELLGIEYDYVSGFRGSAPAHAALLRKEINVQSPNMVTYLKVYKKSSVADGTILPVFYWGLPQSDGTTAPYEALPEIGTFYSYYSKVKGTPPSGPKWDAIKFMSLAGDGMTWLIMAPPKTDPDRVAILRNGFDATMKDTAYLAEVQKQMSLTPTIQSAKQAEAIVQSLKSLDPKIIETMKDSVERANK